MAPRYLKHRNLIVPATFVPAAKGTWTPGKADREIRLIVLHSAECGEVPTAAEALASWANGSSHAKGASWHFAVDNNSITQSVEIYDIAWHAGPVNGYTVGIEQAGRASQTAEQWRDPYSSALLENTAKLLAVLSGMYDIPLDHCTNPKEPGATGVCTHADVTKAWGTKGGHTDPGLFYPMEWVLMRAAGIQLEAVR